MSEEFVRCPECGNINIKGIKKCVFCDTDVLEAEVVTHEVEAPPEIAVAPPVEIPATISPELESVEETSSPKLPDFDKIDKPIVKKKKTIEKDILVIDSAEQKYTFGQKLLFISLFTVLVSLIHYSLNFLIALASIDITDQNLNIIPFPANLADFLQIRGISFLLSIPFAVLIGYVLGKIVRKFTSDKKSTMKWVAFSFILDVVLNITYAVVLVILTNALDEKDILFTWITGAVFIFLITIVITLFIPMISGSFFLFGNIDKVFFRRKYAK
ncbi:MAG: hypothetical protein H7644_10105 [Candidatus Heimdallarchaeota archaeon]|nr:hypothetical protein [Candidatus Heimdallarchaeota archaeon]MCK5144108.1 hypothetical protein [Candidatus Heimdallarchaeota archaeon]